MNELREALGIPTLYLIWSFERDQWWKPSKADYTRNPAEAGVYGPRQAEEICAEACYMWRPDKGLPPEVKVLLPMEFAIVRPETLTEKLHAEAMNEAARVSNAWTQEKK